MKAVLTDAADRELITSNPTSGLKIKVAKPVRSRERGFTTPEATAVLRASRTYTPKPSDNPQTRESAELVAAKQWAPLLCAHSGARIAEITQLRKEDIREIDGIPFMRITPDAGSVKTGQFRDVPLHSQIIEEGFLAYVEASRDGPLFYKPNPARKGTTHPSKAVSGRISQWLQASGLVPEGVQPNHAWRHRFKTVGMEVGASERVLDAIEGHAPRTAGESYGDVLMKAKAVVVGKMPPFQLG